MVSLFLNIINIMKKLIKLENYLINPEFIQSVKIIIPKYITFYTQWKYAEDHNTYLGETPLEFSIPGITIEINIYNLKTITFYKKVNTILKIEDLLIDFIDNKGAESPYDHYVNIPFDSTHNQKVYNITLKELLSDLSILKAQQDILEKTKLELEHKFRSLMKFNTIEEIKL